MARQCLVEEALDTTTPRSRSVPQSGGRRQTSIERAVNCRDDLVRCDPDFGDIHDRALRSRDSNALARDDIRFGERPRRRVDDDAGLVHQPSAHPGHREMHGGCDDVGEPQERECRFVRDNGVGCLT